jgi:type IV secretory pathway VirD2 relaxase
MAETILDRLAKRVPLPARDEEYLLAKKVKKAIFNLKRLPKSKNRVKKSRGGLYSMGARGVYVKDGDIYSRRVVIKAKIIKNKSASFKENIHDYLKYITRADAGIDGKKPELLSANEKEINQKDILETYSKAPHSFRFIISPEDGDSLDLKEFTKNLLNTIERDLESKLDWVAAVHHDTNEPHVHLLVNGNDRNGQKLLMTRDYISHGMRNRASKIITNTLGLRDYDDIIKSLSL